MINFSESCVFCDSTDDLNTVMTMSVEDKDYKVAIGDSCEDDALPKKIKEALKVKIEEHQKKQDDKKSRLEKLREEAKELGFELVPIGSKIAVPVKTVSAAPPRDLAGAPTIEQNGSKFVVQRNTRNVSSDKGMSQEQARTALEVAQQRGVNSFPSTEAGQASEHGSHLLPESVQTKNGGTFRPENISKVNQTVPGRCGIPTTIPEKLISTGGETEIKIINTGGDNLIQRRMRALNEAAMRSEGSGMPSAMNADRMNACPSCDGVGKVKNKLCIRCRGIGFMGVM